MESNHRTQIRSLPLYPLSYGAGFGQSSARWTRNRQPDGGARRGSGRGRRRTSTRSRRSTRPARASGRCLSATFRKPRAYVGWTFSEQDEAEVWFGDPIVTGDRATCEYWGVVTYQGRTETIAGVSVIRFGEDGLVIDQRDYWNAEDGRREPPEGWAR